MMLSDSEMSTRLELFRRLDFLLELASLESVELFLNISLPRPESTDSVYESIDRHSPVKGSQASSKDLLDCRLPMSLCMTGIDMVLDWAFRMGGVLAPAEGVV